MRVLRRVSAILTTAGLLMAATAASAQGPGGVPGAPMQRLGPSRSQATGAGAPGAPMARLGRGRPAPQTSTARRNYGGLAGVPGVMSSQQFRAGTIASQASGGTIMRSSAGVINNATRGAVTAPANPR